MNPKAKAVKHLMKMIPTSATNALGVVSAIIDAARYHETEDGYQFDVGSHVWIRNDVEGKDPIQRIVLGIGRNKVMLVQDNPSQSIGAKRDVVFALKDNAYWPEPKPEPELSDLIVYGGRGVWLEITGRESKSGGYVAEVSTVNTALTRVPVMRVWIDTHLNDKHVLWQQEKLPLAWLIATATLVEAELKRAKS